MNDDVKALVARLRADAHVPGVAPATALQAADALEAERGHIQSLAKWVGVDESEGSLGIACEVSAALEAAQRPPVGPEVREEVRAVLASVPVMEQRRYDGEMIGHVLSRDELAERETDALLARFSFPSSPVYDIHRRAHAVFSWNSGMKYEDPCPHCDGKAGVHDCGCWADSDVEYVCAECHRLGSRSSGVYNYAWPCATVRAVTGDDERSTT